MSESACPDPPQLSEGLALLAGFLLSSARGLMDEPGFYGVFRCMDGARRALELLEASGAHDPRLAAVRTDIERLATGPQQPFDAAALLDGLCCQVAHAVREPAPAADTSHTPDPGAPAKPTDIEERPCHIP
ncbi:DUF6092 family protein [Streptomyces sp. NPDC007100]|uniref:DUF6092 family protein n=1 Tax=Streptomyces sp. NPDC007100 TaxID=3155602 RepID=UPI0033FBC3B3